MPKKILVVEDHPDFRNILLVTLKKLGYQTIEAEVGAQAVERGLTECPDLILMDIGLPGMTGIEAARALKENALSAHIPIVACTAWDPNEWRNRAFEAGMVDYLMKPISLALLKQTIEKFTTYDEP